MTLIPLPYINSKFSLSRYEVILGLFLVSATLSPGVDDLS